MSGIQLQAGNKGDVLARAVGLAGLLSVLLITYYFKTSETFAIVSLTCVLAIAVLYLRFKLPQNDLVNVELIDGEIRYNLKGQRYAIGFSEIETVRKSLNYYISSKGQLSTRYTLIIKKMQPFGNELILNFDGIRGTNEPQVIKIIKNGDAHLSMS